MLALTVPATAAEPTPGPPAVTALRFGVDKARTRLVLEADRPLPFTASAVDDPPRLLVDLPALRWRLPQPEAAPQGLVRAYRYGPLAADRSRLVLDIGQAFTMTGRLTLPPGDGHRTWRIVIDLEPAAAIPALGSPTGADRAVLAPPTPPDPPLREVPLPSLAALPRPLPRPAATALENPLIIVDPGHGGVDPGTRGVNGVPEKTVTLAVALALRDQLLATRRYRVRLTREGDVFVPLQQRLALGRSAGAALFVSLHADAIADRSLRGASVYTLAAQPSDAAAARVSAAENGADRRAGAEGRPADPLTEGILADLQRRDVSNAAIILAERLLADLRPVTRLLRKGRRAADFVVLRNADTPSVLVELGYLSNPTDAANLADPAHRGRVAARLARAIDRWFARDR